MRSLVLIALIGLAMFVPGEPARAQPAIALEPAFGGQRFERPVALKQPPGDAGQVFVVEQPGRVLVVPLAGGAPAVVLDIRDRVEDGPNEAGLLGLAFHPAFADNRTVFLSYTRRPAAGGLESVIAAYRVRADATIDADSERIVLTLAQPFSNHNGGDIAFGPDGYLYIGFGDGGAGGDPLNSGQDVGTLLGAILRIDVDRAAPYAIPRDNPLRARRGARGEIYAYGLRNPWRFSFDRLTGDLWAADVGQNRMEEVNVIVAGGNYGWNIKEASRAFRDQGRSAAGLIDPVAEYGRELGCSVTGGYVYRGGRIPELEGVYLFGDYCSGRIWGVVTDAEGRRRVRELLRADARIASFGEIGDGTLFVLDLEGPIYRIVAKQP